MKSKESKSFMNIILSTILLFAGCSNILEKIPPAAFPEQVNDFRRQTIESSSERLVATSYAKENSAPPITIWVYLRLEENIEKAKESWMNGCSDFAMANFDRFLLLKSELKDKAGKTRGVIKICKSKEYQFYFMEMSKDNLAMYFSNIATPFNPLTAKDLLEFAKNIPHNADFDFDSLKIAETEAIEKEIYQKEPEFVIPKVLPKLVPMKPGTVVEQGRGKTKKD